MSQVDVIAIDGPVASGKGSVSSGVAKALDFHVLDSGALYRLTALACMNQCGFERRCCGGKGRPVT